VKACRGQNNRVKLSAIELAQSSVHVTAHRLDQQIPSHRKKLSLTAEAAGAEACSYWEVFEGDYSVACDKRVTHVFTLAVRPYMKAWRKLAGQILQAVHGKVHVSIKDRLFEFPCE
jgi:hypothetical protein